MNYNLFQIIQEIYPVLHINTKLKKNYSDYLLKYRDQQHNVKILHYKHEEQHCKTNVPVTSVPVLRFTAAAEEESVQLLQSAGVHSCGSQHRGRTPLKGHQINLRGRELNSFFSSHL